MAYRESCKFESRYAYRESYWIKLRCEIGHESRDAYRESCEANFVHDSIQVAPGG